MFTGIINHMGQVIRVIPQSNCLQIEIASQFSQLSIGESIAVDGICLTVTAVQHQNFSALLSTETLAVTNAGQMKVGQHVNLERALRASDFTGGHFVTGHVDNQTTVIDQKRVSDCVMLKFAYPNSTSQQYVVPKGSVAMNGVSLTVNTLDQNGFSVMLIPHTLAITNLKDLKVKMCVNVEFDMIAKSIAHQIQNYLRSDVLKTQQMI